MVSLVRESVWRSGCLFTIEISFTRRIAKGPATRRGRRESGLERARPPLCDGSCFVIDIRFILTRYMAFMVMAMVMAVEIVLDPFGRGG